MASVEYGPDGRTLAAAGYDGSAYLWNVATRAVIATLDDPGVNADDYAAVFSPDGRLLATADDSGSTYLWDLASRAIIAALNDFLRSRPGRH